MLWFFGVVLVSMLYLFNIEHRKLEDAMATITGIFYVVFFSFHVTLVDQAGPYGLMLWLIVITAFGTDIMAYFSGYLLGKHKLCPHISPKKTIEGSVGGVLGSVILSGLFGWFFLPDLLIHCLVIGVLIIVSLYNVVVNYPMAIVAQRRGMLSMLSMLLFVGSSLFFIPFNCHGITLITAIPLSYMFTQYFISHRTRWLGNVLFLLFIAACVLFIL